MRRTDHRPPKWIVCLMIALCAGFVILCIQQLYLRITTEEAPKICAPVMVPSKGTTAPTISLPPARLMPTPAISCPNLTGSSLFDRNSNAGTHYALYTTSGARVHSVGSGMASTGSSFASSRTTAARGITYNHAYASIPTITMAGVAGRTETQTADIQRYRPHVRGIQANGDGSYDGETKEEGGYTYYWDEASETWMLTMPVGTIKTEGGITYMWNGSAWEVVTGTDPLAPAPIGNIPWWIVILLAGFYGIAKSVREA